jgi:hypothetical protein
MNNPTATLVELRKHYQSIATQAEQRANEVRAQIAHIDALLVNGLVQFHASTAATAPLETSILPPEDTAEADQVKAKAVARSAKAIASPSVKKGEISLMPAYTGLNKLEAIAKVLSGQVGQPLHQNAIIQLLYGNLGPEELTEARRKMRASLYQGTTKGLWQKAPHERSSYWIPAPTSNHPQAITKTPPADPKPISPQPLVKGKGKASIKQKSSATAPENLVKSPTRGRAQILVLPPQYEGLSKIEAVSKVLQENLGNVMHIDTIIAKLYGVLSPKAITAERVRMKDVMKRGVERKLWQKAPGVTSSIMIGESRSSTVNQTQAKPTTRKPKVSVKPDPKTSATKLKQPKRKQAELVALLKKGGVNV